MGFQEKGLSGAKKAKLYLKNLFPACLFREFLVYLVHELTMLYIMGREPFTLSQQISPAPQRSFLVNLRNEVQRENPISTLPCRVGVECAAGAGWINQRDSRGMLIVWAWACSWTGEWQRISDFNPVLKLARLHHYRALCLPAVPTKEAIPADTMTTPFSVSVLQLTKESNFHKRPTYQWLYPLTWGTNLLGNLTL